MDLEFQLQKLSSIFRPFQRAHGKQIEGFGIGLASVKKLIQAMSGNIEVSSIAEKAAPLQLR